jgi:hypothetical protein
MKRIVSIIIAILVFGNFTFAQVKEFADTVEAHNAGYWETKDLLKKNYKDYKKLKILTVKIKIRDVQKENDWYMFSQELSDYGEKIDNGFSEDNYSQDYDLERTEANDAFGKSYKLSKKRDSEWNTLLSKKGWKDKKDEAGTDAVPITVKRANDADGTLYGKLCEINETKDLIKQGYVSKKQSGKAYEPKEISVQNSTVTLYKEIEHVATISNQDSVNKKKLDQLHTELAHNKTELEELRNTIKNIIVVVVLLIFAVALFLFFKKKKSNIKKKSGDQAQMQTLSAPTIDPATGGQELTVGVIDVDAVTSSVTESTSQPSKTPPVTPPMPTTTPTAVTKNIAFAKDADEWIIVGASVIGNGHITTGTPCQDSHKYEYLGEGWGIAVTSDGAGSAVNSHIGSKIVAERTVAHFKNLIIGRNWIKKNELPTETEWSQIAFATLRAVRNEMEQFAKTKGLELKSLYATAIVVIHTPEGILATHIGDGRAGYRNQQGEWKALITPHKGEEANQTIFVPSDFWDIPAYKMSGVLVPESVVVKEKPFAFTLMSDGCESTSWLYNQQDEKTGNFFDPNKPYPNFFNPLDETLQSFRKDKVNEQERAEKWKNFIESGNPSFVKETDDKTMILGVIYI